MTCYKGKGMLIFSDFYILLGYGWQILKFSGVNMVLQHMAGPQLAPNVTSGKLSSALAGLCTVPLMTPLSLCQWQTALRVSKMYCSFLDWSHCGPATALCRPAPGRNYFGQSRSPCTRVESGVGLAVAQGLRLSQEDFLYEKQLCSYCGQNKSSMHQTLPEL